MSDWPTTPIGFQQNPYGGAITFDYLLDTGVSNADPGSGKFRLNNATENTATALYINTTSFDGVALGTVLDNLTNSTNANKALLRIVGKSDTTKFLLFYITGETTHTGYREFALTIIASSAASPFAAADECLLAIDQIGNVGAQGPSGGGGAMILISSQVLGSDAANVAFSSIPATYNHLMLVCYGRITEAVVNDYIYMQFNGDTGANYDRQHAAIFNATVSNAAEYAQTAIRIGDFAAASATRSAQASMSKVFIPNYAGTTFEKLAKIEGYGEYNTSGTGLSVLQNGGNWRSAAAITSILIFPAANNFKAGSAFYLYGVT